MPKGKYIRTAKMCKNISDGKKGKPNYKTRGILNCNWKGNNVSYRSLHEYMRKTIPIPKRCAFCKKIKPLDLMNVGVYNRDLKNWKYGCRKCHMKKDGRLKNFLRNRYVGYGKDNPFFGRKSKMPRDNKGRFVSPKFI